WSVSHAPGTAEAWPPLPGNVQQLPIWNLGDGQFLLDDRVEFSPQATKAAAATIFAAKDDLDPGSGGGTNYPGSGGSGFNFNTNGLWLEITNVDSDSAFLNLH